MANKFVFSILMAFYNSENYLNEAIDSLINQSFDFNKVQLILIDDGSTDSSKEIALEYQSKYPNNILVLSKENGGQGSACNLALSHIKGEYVNFLDSDDKLSENTLNAVYKFFSKNEDINVIALPIVFFEKNNKEQQLNVKFKAKTLIIDLDKNPEIFQLSLSSTFIRKDALKDYKFEERLLTSYGTFLINKILLDNRKYGLIGLNDNAIYYYRKRSLKDSNSYIVLDKKEFFINKLKYFSKPLLDYSISKENKAPDFIQYVVLKNLNPLLRIPDLHEDLTKKEINIFWNYLNDILKLTDKNCILKHPFLTDDIKSFLFYLKTKKYHIDIKSNSVLFYVDDFIVEDLSKSKIIFDVVEIKDNFLNILGCLPTNFYKENIFIEAIKESNKSKESFKAEYFDFPYSKRKNFRLLGFDWKFYSVFNFKIPLKKLENCRISFKIIYKGSEKSVSTKPGSFRFSEIAGLSGYSHYFIKDSHIVFYSNNSFNIIPYNYKKIIRFEINSFKKILSSRKSGIFHAFFYRFLFIILFPFMKNRKIWLFNDRPYVADENGEHLFKYSIKQDDDIEKYYVLDKNSKDFKRMRMIDKNIISLGSFKHKILFLFADKLITPFINEDFFNPFYFKNRRFYNGFITSRIYFIQHGILVGSYSRFINRFRKNLALFVTSADLERESILKGGYNFDKDVVQVLGLPRYDNLRNDNSIKQILFMPTWRNYLKEKDTLLKSDYFKKLISFLNNEKLIKISKEKGYKIAFRPHPEVMKYIDLFEINNEVVWISSDESYQELFNSSSLLVTDYSSVFFDFSYLKKPVIYYQYEDEYHYEKGYFDFETMGFGEVIDSEEALVDKIIEYIENDCVMEDKYKQRVDKFYKFTDQNNCKRVYEWIYDN